MQHCGRSSSAHTSSCEERRGKGSTIRELITHGSDVETSTATCKRTRNIIHVRAADVCQHIFSRVGLGFEKVRNPLRIQRAFHSKHFTILFPAFILLFHSPCTADMMNDLVTAGSADFETTRHLARISKRSRMSGYTHINSHVQYLKLLEKNKYWEKLNYRAENAMCESTSSLSSKFDCSSVTRKNLFGIDKENNQNEEKFKVESQSLDDGIYNGFRNELFFSSRKAAIFFDFDRTLSADHIHDLMKASQKGLSDIDVTRAFGGTQRVKRLERFLSGLLSSGAILHILSLGHKEKIMESLRAVGLDHLFPPTVIYGCDELRLKRCATKAQCALLIADSMGLKASDVLLVDDDHEQLDSDESFHEENSSSNCGTYWVRSGQGLSDRDMAAIGGMVAIKLRETNTVVETCHLIQDPHCERHLGLVDT
eukprot:754963-Hanusia_phi.AAC.1